MLRDVLLETEESDVGMIVTTFASHVARVNSIVKFAQEMGRIPVLMGSSMERYIATAHQMGYIELPENVEIYGNRREIDKAFARIMEKGKNKYLPVVTGHQGEPGAVLGRPHYFLCKYYSKSNDTGKPLCS
jgi:ribonuclease J